VVPTPFLVATFCLQSLIIQPPIAAPHNAQKPVADALEYTDRMFYDADMANPESSLKHQRVNVRMTGAMYANLKRLAGSDRHVADEIRKAIQQHLDDKAEITGSRRYFTGRFRDEVRNLNRMISWHLTLITIMLAEVSSILIMNLIEMDEKTAKNFTASSLLKIAEERLVESGWRVKARVDTAIDDAELEGQRQQDLVEE